MMKMRIRHLLLAAFVFVIGSSAAQGQSNTFLGQIGVCTSVQNAEIVQKANGQYIEEAIRGFLIPTESEAAFAANRTAAQNSVLPIYSGNVMFPGEFKLLGPEMDEEKVLAFARTAYGRASSIGMKMLVLGSGGARRIPEGYDRQKAREEFIAVCRKLAAIAADAGVMVVLEPLNSAETNFVTTVTEGAEIVREVNHPNFRLLADFYHMMREGEPAEAILKTEGLLYHCHIAEKENRTAPGVKGDDFRPFFRALRRIGYQGAISIECRWDDLPAQVQGAIAEMRSQIAETE